MSRLISEILNAPEPSFSQQIEQLELLAGRPGIDIKLATELPRIFREKAKSLDLDENDTMVRELYFSMSKLALSNSNDLAKMLDIKNDDSPRQMIEKSIKYVEKKIGKKNIWALKSSVARRQLKENPPKKLMRVFGIRSIESALKRESLSLFYCFASFTEPVSWFNKYVAQAGNLTNSDFDSRTISISIIPVSRQKQLTNAGIRLNQIVFSDQESAGIEIAIPDKRFEGDVLFVVDSLLTQIKTMLRRSAYYRHQGFKTEFFSKVEKIRAGGFRYVEMDNHPFDWPTLIHATTELGAPSIIQDHESILTAEDLLVPSLHQLARFNFWQHPFGLHQKEGLVISFNISDMIINAVNKTVPEKAYVENARDALRWELFGRYLGHSRVHEAATKLYSYEGEEA
ncbi:MAG TPA: hypothetical protein VD947_01720 [Patescibacteria group bacterium]|nr:hypothetical protein [Patescibacteria group bacterium]